MAFDLNTKMAIKKQPYNQTLLIPAIEKELIQAILIVTKGWRPGTYTMPFGSPAYDLLQKNELTNEVYLCITPKLTIYRADVAREYRNIYIDLRAHPLGNPSCEHKFVELYWEEGGGGLGSGHPHRYAMCTKCGAAHKSHAVASTFNFLKPIFRWLGR